MKQAIRRGLQRTLIGMVRCYRLAVSPYLAPRCRYTPTCSAYAIESLERHGPWRGSVYAVRRLLRCHPWGGSGFDPVPDAAKRKQAGDEV
ncbi:MAG TPA: membrane protein insertion efficiency factor YidD [Candidatus Macondimonas sp.]|nr:membrane protein insertion efficiency factor YidD [Candidatus Macondimonas sp.]